METRELLYVGPEQIAEGFSSDVGSAGWRLHTAPDMGRAGKLLASHDFHVGLALLDPVSNNQTMTDLKEACLAATKMEWIALLDRSSLECNDLCRMVKDCFFDYHTIPADTQRLLTIVGHASGMARISRRLSSMDKSLSEEEMVGASAAMQNVFETIRKLASVDAPVLITGESGTGKELAAKAIHERSSRSQGPFVAVNCAALPSTLIQSELFGHEKGAFTGAHQRRIGRIESAANGTVFLDEIGDLPLELQANLLRFLQEKTIERIGGRKSIRVDVRVIAATNVDLEQAVRDSGFREDLYYRLNVLSLEMPALRLREDDVELLARYFFDCFAREKNKSVRGFSQSAFQVMRSYHWPGNVRELINRVRRALVMSEKRLLTPGDLGLDRRKMNRQLRSLEQARNEAEKHAILIGMHKARNNVSRAAQQLGVSRVTLYRLLEKHGIAI